MFTTLIILAVLTTVAQIIYTVRCNKEDNAHTDAMRQLWAEKDARKTSYPKAIINSKSVYHPSNKAKA